MLTCLPILSVDANANAPSIAELPPLWRARALEVRRYGAAEGAACAYELAAMELEQCSKSQADRLLAVGEGAALVCRHRDTIGAAVAAGRLANHGSARRPLVRAGDLTQQFPPRGIVKRRRSTYHPDADARSLLTTRRGG
jgi:hypothetical protein